MIKTLFSIHSEFNENKYYLWYIDENFSIICHGKKNSKIQFNIETMFYLDFFDLGFTIKGVRTQLDVTIVLKPKLITS